MISSRELFLGPEQSWIDRFRPSPWIWSPERALVAWIERSREQLRAMFPQAKEMQMDDRRAQSPSYRCDLTQTIRSGQTVDEVGATAIQDLMKRGVFVYNSIQPRLAARAQAVGFSSNCPWRIGIATTICWVG
jgi:hypothetical protein